MSEFDDMNDDDMDDNNDGREDERPEDDELPTLEDMFQCGNDEDNEEAALDFVLKIQENSSD